MYVYVLVHIYQYYLPDHIYVKCIQFTHGPEKNFSCLLTATYKPTRLYNTSDELNQLGTSALSVRCFTMKAYFYVCIILVPPPPSPTDISPRVMFKFSVTKILCGALLEYCPLSFWI